MTKSFCPLLFQHLATHPSGSVSHCCAANHDNMISHAFDGHVDDKTYQYNLNIDSIGVLYNSENFKTARLNMLNGMAPSACNRCFEEEAQGVLSKRQTALKSYPKYRLQQAREITNIDGSINDVQFDFIELRLGNTCNVKCRTCNPASSSKWREDYDKLKTVVSFSIPQYNNTSGFRWHESDEFWDDLYEHSKKAQVFYINGGEPMLIKQHFKFLERLIERGQTDVTLQYNINMTIMNQQAIDLWENFKSVRVSASIDDLGDRNNYIRYPSEWNTVLKNVEILRGNPSIHLDITQTISWMNYTNLVPFWQFFNDLNIEINYNPVYEPAFMSPNVLPTELRERTQQEIYSSNMQVDTKRQLKALITDEFDSKMWKRAQNYTQHLDNIRNQSILDFLPEFIGYFND